MNNYEIAIFETKNIRRACVRWTNCSYSVVHIIATLKERQIQPIISKNAITKPLS
jgi:hypothetical protein